MPPLPLQPQPGRIQNVTVIDLPNKGREADTFARHVAARYDSLADYTVFSQASGYWSLTGCVGRGERGRGEGGVQGPLNRKAGKAGFPFSTSIYVQIHSLDCCA